MTGIATDKAYIVTFYDHYAPRVVVGTEQLLAVGIIDTDDTADIVGQHKKGF